MSRSRSVELPHSFGSSWRPQAGAFNVAADTGYVCCLLAYGGVLLSAPISHGRRADGLRDLPANRCNELKGPGVGMDSPIDIRRSPSTPGLNGVDDRRGPARGSHHGTEPPWLPGPDSGGRRAAGATTPGVDLTREPCPSSRRDLEPSAGHPDDDECPGTGHSLPADADADAD